MKTIETPIADDRQGLLKPQAGFQYQHYQPDMKPRAERVHVTRCHPWARFPGSLVSLGCLAASVSARSLAAMAACLDTHVHDRTSYAARNEEYLTRSWYVGREALSSDCPRRLW